MINWIALLLALLPAPLSGQALSATEFTGVAVISMAPDSTVKLGSRIVVSGWAPTDTVQYTYYRDDTLIFVHRSRAFKDSTTAPAPAYGLAVEYRGCARVERGGRQSGITYPEKAICWSWQFVRQPPLGTIDSIIRLTIIPLGPKLVVDSGSTCQTWQAANPTKTPWITVNVRAVNPCEHTDSLGVRRLSIWQYCVFAEDKAGRKVKTKNSWNNPYCEEQNQTWRSG